MTRELRLFEELPKYLDQLIHVDVVVEESMFAHREDAERGFLGEEASRDLGGFLNPRLVAVAFGELSDFGASPR